MIFISPPPGVTEECHFTAGDEVAAVTVVSSVSSISSIVINAGDGEVTTASRVCIRAARSGCICISPREAGDVRLADFEAGGLVILPGSETAGIIKAVREEADGVVELAERSEAAERARLHK
jgi:hypothetical protein